MDTVAGAELDAIVRDTRKYKLGSRVEDVNGNEFILLLYNEGDGAEEGTEGHHVCFLDSAFTPYEVTADNNSATIKALLNRPGGQLQATAADGERIWAQYKGYSRKATIADAAVAQNQRLMLHATTAGGVDTSAGVVAEIGVALEDDTDGNLAAGLVYLDIPL